MLSDEVVDDSSVRIIDESLCGRMSITPESDTVDDILTQNLWAPTAFDKAIELKLLNVAEVLIPLHTIPERLALIRKYGVILDGALRESPRNMDKLNTLITALDFLIVYYPLTDSNPLKEVPIDVQRYYMTTKV